MAILAALGAALLYALASVFQQWEAELQPPERALRPSLVARLARRPRWLLGLGFDGAGYACQWVALSRGSLVVVQPLLVVSLLLALPIKARLAPYRMRPWDWSGAVLTTAGLGMFLAVSRPAPGYAGVPLSTWVALLSIVALVAIGLVLLGRDCSPRWRAMAFGTAGGLVFGANAALTKTCAHLLSRGPVTLLSNWEPYVMLVAGACGMVLSQSAFQAGPLDASLPTLTAMDPLVSVVVGALAFGETLQSGVIAHVFELISFSAVVVGIFVLAHTEATKAAQARHFDVVRV